MNAGPLTAAVAGGAAIVIVMLYTVAAIRKRQSDEAHASAMRTIDVTETQGDVLVAGGARFRVTFADGTTEDVDADGWRSGNSVDQVIMLHHVIDLTGSHEDVVASFDHVTQVQRIDAT